MLEVPPFQDCRQVIGVTLDIEGHLHRKSR
jgi:hypothetical protein